MQSLKEKIQICHEALTKPRKWQWRLLGEENWEAGRNETEMYECLGTDRYEIRFAPLTLLIPGDGRPCHNPDNLTAEQVGEGYRLLLPEELGNVGDYRPQCWESGGWDTGEWIGNSDASTYRVSVTIPWPPHRWAKEMEAYKRGEKLELRLEKGWEPLSIEILAKDWNDPANEFRIAPKTRIVPLEKSDWEGVWKVRRITDKGKGWEWNITGTCEAMVNIGGTGDNLTHGIMMDQYERRRVPINGEKTEWESCSKEVSE